MILLPFVRKLVGRFVAQAAVRPLGVVPLAPDSQSHLNIGGAQENLLIQELVTKAAVEALGEAVLPRAAWIDVSHFRLRLVQVAPQSQRDELWPVVHSQKLGSPAPQRNGRQCRRRVQSREAQLDPDCQALSRELVCDGKHPQLPARDRLLLNKVYRPDLVSPLRAIWPLLQRRAECSFLFGLASNTEALGSPQAVYALMIYPLCRLAAVAVVYQCMSAAVAEAGVLCGNLF